MIGRAAVLESFGAPFRVTDVTLRPPGPGEALVQIEWAGLCHTDIAQADGEHPHPLPVVLGHEGAGVVAAVGSGVRSVAKGDRVVFNLAPECGTCRYCLRGYPAHCLRWPGEGRLSTGSSPISSSSGSVATYAGSSCFASHAVVAASSLITLPDEVPLDIGAVIGCAVITGFGAAVNASQIRPGSRGAVIGGGGVGVASIQAARVLGASEVTVVDPVAERRAGAVASGATGELDPGDDRAVGQLERLSGSEGWDWAIVAAPSVSAIDLALRLLAPLGNVVVVGSPPGEIAVSVRDLVPAEKTIRGSTYGSGRPQAIVEQIVALYRAGMLDLDALISHRVPLDDINEAVRMSRSAEGLRVLLSCAAESG